MRSRVAKLAKAAGIPNAQQLSYAARITHTTARTVWNGDLSKTRGDTLRKLKDALGCAMDDLYVYDKTKEAA